MKESEVDRMKQDLNVIHQALGLDPLVSWDDVWFLLALGGLGAVLMLGGWIAIARPEFKHAVQLGSTVAVLILCSIYMVHRYRQKQKQPAGWREARLGLVILAVMIPAAIAFVIWARHERLSFPAIFSALIFSIGVAYVTMGFANRARLYCIGFGFPAMVLGFFFPSFVKLHLLEMFLGILASTSGLFSAGIVAWQIRSRRHG